VITKPRPNFGEDLERAGIYYWSEKAIEWDQKCDVSDTYWNDLGAIEIADKKTEADVLMASTNLYGMMLEATDVVVNDDKLLKIFSIPEILWGPIK
jgi:glutathionylspermidine synthase